MDSLVMWINFTSGSLSLIDKDFSKWPRRCCMNGNLLSGCSVTFMVGSCAVFSQQYCSAGTFNLVLGSVCQVLSCFCIHVVRHSVFPTFIVVRYCKMSCSVFFINRTILIIYMYFFASWWVWVDLVLDCFNRFFLCFSYLKSYRVLSPV